jgi:hypothetical protein
LRKQDSGHMDRPGMSCARGRPAHDDEERTREDHRDAPEWVLEPAASSRPHDPARARYRVFPISCDHCLPRAGSSRGGRLRLAAGAARADARLMLGAALLYPLAWYLLHRFVLHSRWMWKSRLLSPTWKRIHYDHHQIRTTSRCCSARSTPRCRRSRSCRPRSAG